MDTHLNNIGVQNFRVFKDEHEFKFAPITILTGTNSSGKSSLINLLKLLSETYKGITWQDSAKESFNLNNFLETGIPKNWCIKRFGNLENITNKFNPEKNVFSFSYISDLTGYENSINLKTTYEFEIQKESRSEIKLKKIGIIINEIKHTKIIEELSLSMILNNQSIDDLIQKEIFSINFVKSKNSNSKIALDILFNLFDHHRTYNLNLQVTEFLLQNPSTTVDIKLLHEHLTILLHENNSIDKLEPAQLEKMQSLQLEIDNEKKVSINDLTETEKIIRHSYFIDSWYSFNRDKLNKIDDIIKRYFGNIDTAKNHKGFNTELFKLLSNVIWHSSYYQNTPVDDSVDTSYIYFGTLPEYFNIKSTYGFSLQDFVKRRFDNLNLKNIIDEDYWLDPENKLFFSYELLNIDFIKNVFLPVIQIILDDANLDLGYNQGTKEGREAYFLSENTLHLNKDKNFKVKDIHYDFNNLFKISTTEKTVYDFFVYGILKNIFEPLEGLKIIDSIATQRTYESRVESILSKDETSIRIAANTLDIENLHKLKVFWKKHLQSFEIADDIEIKIDHESMYYKIFLLVNQEWVNLKDMGFGVSQVIPILLSLSQEPNQWAWLNPEHEPHHLPIVMLIEEPESNLHPALQSKLADFFVEAAEQFNIQFIIETHSEYLIRKLQYLTAKKVIKPEDTQLYYFHHPDRIPKGEKQIYPINIRKDGSLTKNFGSGFFDEAGNIALELFLLKNEQSN